MQLSIMTFNILHGVDYINYNRRNKAHLKASNEMTPESLKKLKTEKPAGEDPSLIDLSLTVKAIQTCGAELIGLNEVRDVAPGMSDPCFTPQAQEIAEGLGYSYYYFGRAIHFPGKGRYGNALVSKYPILHAETIPVPDPAVKDEPVWYETRCVIKAVIDVNGQPLAVLVTHMGLASSEAKNAVQTVRAQVQPGVPTVLMGDFNLTPESPILEPLRAVFTDAGSLLAPGADLTYPSDAPATKIDYIMAAGPVSFVKAEIPPVVVSDHRAHTAVIEF